MLMIPSAKVMSCMLIVVGGAGVTMEMMKEREVTGKESTALLGK
jgi:hypothetical protein